MMDLKIRTCKKCFWVVGEYDMASFTWEEGRGLYPAKVCKDCYDIFIGEKGVEYANKEVVKISENTF